MPAVFRMQNKGLLLLQAPQNVIICPVLASLVTSLSLWSFADIKVSVCLALDHL